MKKLKLPLIILSTLLLTAYWAIASPVLVFKTDQSDQEANPETLRSYVEWLCSTEQYRNAQHSHTLLKVADHLKSELSKYTNRVEFQDYTSLNSTFRNVIASFGPEDGPRIIVGAHYDVCYDQPGADDNASGVAGLLELSRMLSNVEDQLTQRIDLVAYTLEEPPFFRTYTMGSAQHAKMLHDTGVEVDAMICLEMIGYFTDEENSQEYPVKSVGWFYPDQGDYIAVVGKLFKGKLTRHLKKSIKKGADIPVSAISAPESLPGIDFSDHLNYWKYGWHAVMITDTAFYRNKAYHTKGDTPDRLNYQKMAEVVEGVYYALLTF